MRRLLLAVLCCATVVAIEVGEGVADVVSPDSSYVVVTFNRTYTGSYRHGEPYDCLTIVPGQGGETLAGTGISIRVYLRNAQGQPVVGVPASDVVIFNASLCTCPGGNLADGPTDANGSTTFSGAIRGGHCATSLSIYAQGILVGTIPVKVNSPDGPYMPPPAYTSPCFVDDYDFAPLVQKIGNPNLYTICSDYNEDGAINASDFAYLVRFLAGDGCQ